MEAKKRQNKSIINLTKIKSNKKSLEKLKELRINSIINEIEFKGKKAEELKSVYIEEFKKRINENIKKKIQVTSPKIVIKERRNNSNLYRLMRERLYQSKLSKIRKSFTSIINSEREKYYDNPYIAAEERLLSKLKNRSKSSLTDNSNRHQF